MFIESERLFGFVRKKQKAQLFALWRDEKRQLRSYKHLAAQRYLAHILQRTNRRTFGQSRVDLIEGESCGDSDYGGDVVNQITPPAFFFVLVFHSSHFS